VKSMDIVHHDLHNRLRRRLAFIAGWFRKLLTVSTPQAADFQSQRMCPSCGLITSRSKAHCLECGKSLSEVRLARQDAN
jgi:transposase